VGEPIAADVYIELSRVSRRRSPATGHLRRDLEMELDPVCMRTPAECLVRVGQGTCEQDGPAREIETIRVPLKHIELGGCRRENRVVATGVRKEDRMDPDFGSWALVHACTQARRQELRAKANAPVRDTANDRLADILTLIS
jgi:hypothetical protein